MLYSPFLKGWVRSFTLAAKSFTKGSSFCLPKYILQLNANPFSTSQHQNIFMPYLSGLFLIDVVEDHRLSFLIKVHAPSNVFENTNIHCCCEKRITSFTQKQIPSVYNQALFNTIFHTYSLK